MTLTILFYLAVLAFSQAAVPPVLRSYLAHPNDATLESYTVAIKNKINGNFCTGAILNETHVITTATCIFPEGNTSGPVQFSILAGNTVPKNTTFTHDVIQIKVHENFTVFPIAINDIALLQVTPSIIPSDTIQFVKLPQNDDATNDIYRSFILGYCTILNRREFHIPDTVFTISAYKYKDRDLRKRMDKHKFEVDNIYTCSLFKNLELYECMYDAGALFTQNGTLVGLMSYNRGNMCRPFIFTRVTSYLTWIK